MAIKPKPENITEKKISKKQTSPEDSIKVLEGLDPVKKRPGMYIGGTGPEGFHHLAYEILDNSIDELTNGFGTTITMEINKDGSLTIEDDGRGIPVAIHSQKKIPQVRLVFEVLHAGGKFDNKLYKTSGGLHGVGASVVNALSSYVKIIVCQDGYEHKLEYEKSALKTDLVRGKKTKITGTKVTFLPDPTYFHDITFDYEILRAKAQELAYLNKGITISLKDQTRKDVYSYKNGVAEYLEHLVKGTQIQCKPFYCSGEQDQIQVEIVMQYTDAYEGNVLSFVNNIKTVDGGKHDEGYKAALTKALNEYLKIFNADRKRNRKEITITGADSLEGLVAIINLKMPEVEFQGQTKAKLGNDRAKTVVQSLFYKAFMDYLKGNKTEATKIITRATTAAQGREAARTAKEVSRAKNKVTGGGILTIDKLASCSLSDPKQCEIFLVEGDSAGGSAKQGRDRKRQAILALRGKILNVEKATLGKILDSAEIKSMIQAFGAGFGHDFNISKINYSKVIIMTDADVDGSHIRVLLLTLFFRYMLPLIEQGYVYVAQPPLYKVSYKDKGKDTFEYAYDDLALEKLKKKVKGNYVIQRYKGLGEMDAEQLWDTTLNPTTRELIKVTLKDAKAADEMFQMLMGSKVDERKKFLEENL